MTKGVICVHKNIREIISEVRNTEFSDYLLPHIIFNSCYEVLVEGSKGILEYNTSTVKINCGKSMLKFCGDKLNIRALSIDEIIVSGTIVSFEFCNI